MPLAMTAAGVLLVSLAFASLSFADTVHFTNSPTQIERTLNSQANDGLKLTTYQLQVPGSVPITIIEAQDQTNPGNRDIDDEDDGRKTKDFLVPGSTHEKSYSNNESRKENRLHFKGPESSRCFGPSCQDIVSDGRKKYVYAPDLLEKFLTEYAERIKNANMNTRNKLNKIGTITNDYSNRVTTEKTDSFSDKVDLNGEQFQNEDKTYHYSWDRNHQQDGRPYNNNKGWVTLEAVPWSTGKISKWKPNRNHNKKPISSWDNDDTDIYQTQTYHQYPDYDSKPRPKPVIINNRPTFHYDSDNPDEIPSRPTWTKPTNNRPDYDVNNDWSSDESRRPNKNNCNKHSGYKYEDSNSYLGDRVDLITDDRPTRFPSYQQLDTPFRRPTEVVYADEERDYSSSHPSSGNGQWVLLSSTKGYHIEKKRQRSINLSPSALKTTKSVTLTVLPADSDKNTTTSHGGMLEVERSFHSVDESKRLLDKEMKNLNSTNEHNRKNRTTSLKRAKISAATPSGPDSTAVLAAVGAGMLPATMAMVVPMMLGRRKRNSGNSTMPNLRYHSLNVT